MIVYRLEDKFGTGVFQGRWFALPGPPPGRHPTPVDEFGDTDWGSRHCGFKSIHQLRRWFNKAQREVITTHGIRLRSYECDPADVLIGKFQIMFTKKSAVKVDCLSPNAI